MKKCEQCGGSMAGKRKTARFCSDFCRLKAFREKNGSRYQKKDNTLKTAKNVKSYTCCENGRFYSPAGRWGEVLICDGCGAVWQRLDKVPGTRNQESEKTEESI